MKKGLISLAVILLIISLSFIQISTKAPDNTRLIIDHSHKIYVAPPCFDDADVTNYLEESTLEQALKINYSPEGTCTEESLVNKVPIIVYLLEAIGVKESRWGKDGQW